mmetsp:Transcript_3460/g.7891  ORF Transcript_3460/g.7891 Transcript_3460/m.7891 type:complete len:336 (-) Transcript_3460:374-1381(-)
MDQVLSGAQEGLGSTLLPQFLHSLRYRWEHNFNEVQLLIRQFFPGTQMRTQQRTLYKLPPLPNTTRWCKNHAAASAYLEKRHVVASQALLEHPLTLQLIADMRERGALQLLRVVGGNQYSAVPLLAYQIMCASSGKPGQYGGWMELLNGILDPTKLMGAYVMHISYALHIEAISFFNSKPPQEVFGEAPLCCRLREEATFVRTAWLPHTTTVLSLSSNAELRQWLDLCAKNYAVLMQSADPTVEEDFRTAYERKLAQSLRSGLDSILKHFFVLPIRGIGSQLAGLGDVLLGPLVAGCILWGLASDTDIPLELSEEAKHLRSQQQSLHLHSRFRRD